MESDVQFKNRELRFREDLGHMTQQLGELIRVSFNGQKAEARCGDSVLEAARANGVAIPSLCFDPRLAPCGACRLCMVEIDGNPRPVAACTTPVKDGMRVDTHTPVLERYRRGVLEMLARNYPATDTERYESTPFVKLLREHGLEPDGQEASEPDRRHPYIAADLARCVLCFRCVRICDELQGQRVWHVQNRADRTSVFVDGPSISESTCVSCGACVDTCPSGALFDRSRFEQPEPTNWTRTTCPYCGTGCELEAGTADGRMIASRPVLDAPVSKGHLCVKGRYAFGFVHSADRVTEPMVREGDTWRAISWEEAIETTARELSRARDRYGPGAVAVIGSARSTNEDNYLAQKFARVVLGTNNVDCCARVCHAPTAVAMKSILGTGAATNSFDDIERAALILVSGSNPTENHPIVGNRIRQAVRRGAKLIVIDPREIELAREATIHLRPRPGTNTALLNAMAAVIVDEDLHHPDRVSNLFEYLEFLKEWSAERGERITGVAAESIREAARLYAATVPAMMFHGLGMTEHSHGTEGVMCLVNLAVLTGNFGKPGSGVNPLRGQNNVQGSAHMGCEPGSLTGGVAIDTARDVFAREWQTPLPVERGLNLMDQLDAAEAGSLKAMWVTGYDILMTNPNVAATRRALAKLEFLVVQDLFLNETAREFAHLFLPACSSFEKDGTFMNSERRIQRVRKAIEPIGHSRADWEIVRDVARAAGFGAQFDYDSPEEIWTEIRRVWPAGAGISYARLESGGLQWPCFDESDPGQTILHRELRHAAVRPIPYVPTQEEPDALYPFTLITGRTLYAFNAGTMTMRTPNLELRPEDRLDVSQEDAGSLGIAEGAMVKVRSRNGEVTLPAHISDTVDRGYVFTTFHDTRRLVNHVTSGHRDTMASTPEYKVTAVALEATGPTLRPFD